MEFVWTFVNNAKVPCVTVRVRSRINRCKKITHLEAKHCNQLCTSNLNESSYIWSYGGTYFHYRIDNF